MSSIRSICCNNWNQVESGWCPFNLTIYSSWVHLAPKCASFMSIRGIPQPIQRSHAAPASSSAVSGPSLQSAKQHEAVIQGKRENHVCAARRPFRLSNSRDFSHDFPTCYPGQSKAKGKPSACGLSCASCAGGGAE